MKELITKRIEVLIEELSKYDTTEDDILVEEYEQKLNEIIAHRNDLKSQSDEIHNELYYWLDVLDKYDTLEKYEEVEYL